MERSFWQAGVNDTYTNDAGWRQVVQKRVSERNFAKDDPRLDPRFYVHPENKNYTEKAHKLRNYNLQKGGLAQIGPTDEYITVYSPYDVANGQYTPRYNETKNKKPRSTLSTHVPKARKENILLLGKLPKEKFEGVKVVPVSNYNPILQNYPKVAPRGISDQMIREKANRLGPERLFGERKAKGSAGAKAQTSTIAEYMTDDAPVLEVHEVSELRAKNLGGSHMKNLLTQKKESQDELNMRFKTRQRGTTNRILGVAYDPVEEARRKQEELNMEKKAAEEAKQRQLERESGFNIVTASDEQGNYLEAPMTSRKNINLERRAAHGVSDVLAQEEKPVFFRKYDDALKSRRRHVEMSSEEIMRSLSLRAGPYLQKMSEEFAAIDSHSTGFVAISSLRNILARFCENLTETEVAKVVLTYDPQASGLVNYVALLTHMSQIVGGGNQRLALASTNDGNGMFQVPTMNAANRLTADEVELMIATKVGDNFGKLQKAFMALDYDRNGRLDYGEFRGLLDRFALDPGDDEFFKLVRKYDSDNSGFVDFDEFSNGFYSALQRGKQWGKALITPRAQV